jgi:dTDP-4-dehydrorhamnose 3,5-epimerase
VSLSRYQSSCGTDIMQINFTHIENCVWIQPQLHNDNRGVFCEIFKHSFLEKFIPAQSNYSFSKKGVLRGIHRTPYAKLVTCVKGSVYDVCVDLRPNSKTYNQYFSINLQDSLLNSLYIPPYCGHGFLATEDSILVYQQDQEYNQQLDESYCWKQYNIQWPNTPLIISTKDIDSCNDTH